MFMGDLEHSFPALFCIAPHIPMFYNVIMKNNFPDQVDDMAIVSSEMIIGRSERRFGRCLPGHELLRKIV